MDPWVDGTSGRQGKPTVPNSEKRIPKKRVKADDANSLPPQPQPRASQPMGWCSKGMHCVGRLDHSWCDVMLLNTTPLTPLTPYVLRPTPHTLHSDTRWHMPFALCSKPQPRWRLVPYGPIGSMCP